MHSLGPLSRACKPPRRRRFHRAACGPMCGGRRPGARYADAARSTTPRLMCLVHPARIFDRDLSGAGVRLRTAQAAIRHSDPSLTANVYTDPKPLDVAGHGGEFAGPAACGGWRASRGGGGPLVIATGAYANLLDCGRERHVPRRHLSDRTIAVTSAGGSLARPPIFAV